MTDLPGYGGAIYCGECYSTNHPYPLCPYMGEEEEEELETKILELEADDDTAGLARALEAVLDVHQKTEHQRAYGFPRADKWEHYCTADNQSWPCDTVEAIHEALEG